MGAGLLPGASSAPSLPTMTCCPVSQEPRSPEGHIFLHAQGHTRTPEGHPCTGGQPCLAHFGVSWVGITDVASAWLQEDGCGAACALSGNVLVPGESTHSPAPPLLSSGGPWAVGWVHTESLGAQPLPPDLSQLWWEVGSTRQAVLAGAWGVVGTGEGAWPATREDSPRLFARRSPSGR